ncbi:MAG: nucleotidyltransferase family protein [Ardenticatenaceae bacterium]|nr:nucleotidyltransferase family protein [Ardenticatenaceae bacterium]
MNELPIKVSESAIAAFCQKWLIEEFALFGSAVRDDFDQNSDVDILVTFKPEARWTLFDHVDMQDELQKLFGRDVDLVSRKGIERSQNHIRRHEIIDSARVVYAAA